MTVRLERGAEPHYPYFHCFDCKTFFETADTGLVESPQTGNPWARVPTLKQTRFFAQWYASALAVAIAIGALLDGRELWVGGALAFGVLQLVTLWWTSSDWWDDDKPDWTTRLHGTLANALVVAALALTAALVG